MMQAAGSPTLVFLVWIVGGILTLFGVLTYAELGSMKPLAGGDYIYVRDGYGPLAGFLCAWTWFIIAKPASVATLAVGMVRVLGTFPALAFLKTNLLNAPLPVTYGHLLAISAVILISSLNYIGIRRAGSFQFFFTLLKILIILTVIALAFSYRQGSWQNLGGSAPGATGGVAGFMIALIAALWAYDGWNDLNMVAGEIRDPGRNIPIALIAGVLIVAVLYMGMNLAIQFAMPPAAIAASDQPASEATRLAIGAVGTAIVSAGMAVSMFVALNGTTMSGARIPFAVARDGYFPHAFATIHPRFRTPSVALFVQAILSIVLVLIGGKFQQLFSLAIFSEWLFYMVSASTVFIFRHREPKAPRPYRAWGYPVVPALFVLCAAVLLVYTFKENLPNSLYGSAVILTGIPLFFLGKLWPAARSD
jgi:APA family basic amino acid/polyamine antiporter